MATKAANSEKSQSASVSTSVRTSKRISNQKRELLVKSNEITKSRPSSAKKPKTKPKKKNEKFDAKKPKKPPTAFFYFLEDFRKEFQEQNPGVKSMRDIGKACGEKWKTMTYEEKVQYYDVATVKRAEFDKAMADYIKKKESGEEEETEEDSEFDE